MTYLKPAALKFGLTPLRPTFLVFASGLVLGCGSPVPGGAVGVDASSSTASDGLRPNEAADAALSDATLVTTDGSGEGGLACGASTCGSGQICLGKTISAGQCPADANCTATPIFTCQAVPDACDAGVSCSCVAADLCPQPCSCLASGLSLTCDCAYP